jgi:hypothetical protein
VITAKCKGKLKLTGSRIGFQPKLTPTVTGLDDWVQRGSSASSSGTSSTTSTASITDFGGSGGLTLACVKYADNGTVRKFYAETVDGAQALLTVGSTSAVIPAVTVKATLYPLTPDVLVYRHYTYTSKTAISILEGPDDSTSQASLRFTSSNIIKIYVNGVPLSSSAYDRSVANKITLTPQLLSSNLIVDVFVYNDIKTAFDTSAAIELEFTALSATTAAGLSLRNTCGWGNVVSINAGTPQILLSCTDLTGLDKNKSYGVAYFTAVDTAGVTVKLSGDGMKLLLSQAPHAFNDKLLTRYLSCADLLNNGVLAFAQNTLTGTYELCVTEDLITKTFEQITINTKLTSAELTNTLASTVTKQATTAAPVAYILGPC